MNESGRTLGDSFTYVISYTCICQESYHTYVAVVKCTFKIANRNEQHNIWCTVKMCSLFASNPQRPKQVASAYTCTLKKIQCHVALQKVIRICRHFFVPNFGRFDWHNETDPGAKKAVGKRVVWLACCLPPVQVVVQLKKAPSTLLLFILRVVKVIFYYSFVKKDQIGKKDRTTFRTPWIMKFSSRFFNQFLLLRRHLHSHSHIHQQTWATSHSTNTHILHSAEF